MKQFIQTIYLLLLLPCLLCACGNTDSAPKINTLYAQDKPVHIRLGTGSKTGAYFDFAQRLEQNLPDKLLLEVINTHGSADNLNRIAQGELDAAIVQNDIAFKESSGRNLSHQKNKTFRSGIPLFKESLYIIVKKSSAITSLSEFKPDDTVWVGKMGSGTRINASYVLKEMGIDWKRAPQECSFPKCLDNATVQAAFFMRASPPRWFNEKTYRLIGIPSEALNRITTQTRYFLRAELPSSSGTTYGATLSVLAYLVLAKDLPKKDAKYFIDSILDQYEELRSPNHNYYLFSSLKEYVAYLPAKRHAGAKASLISHELIAESGIPWWVFIIVPMAITAIILTNRNAMAYDMLGCRTRTGWFIKLVSRFYKEMFTLLLALFLLATALQVARYYEEEYAIENNTRSTLADTSLSDAIIWMVVFVSSGFTEDAQFPKSIPGKLLVTSFPLIGLLTLISLISTSFNRRRNRLIETQRGNYIPKLQDHVLICGWNEKAPGIVIGLTCKEAPQKRKVVVVAELGIDAPLAKYPFNHRLVHYCNGDSADMATLSKAHWESASDAIVLAGTKKKTKRNVRSVLTVLALKSWSERSQENGAVQKEEQNGNMTGIAGIKQSIIHFLGKHNSQKDKSLFVINELLYEENRKRFEAASSDAILDSEAFTNRLVSSSCLGEGVIDFVMDIITHDPFSEIYMVKADVESEKGLLSLLFRLIKKLFKRKTDSEPVLDSRAKWKLAELHNALLQKGVNIIGVRSGETLDTKKIGKNIGSMTFDDQDDIKLVFDDPDHEIDENDQLLYLANDQQTLTHLDPKKIRAEEKNTFDNIGTTKNQSLHFQPSKIKVLAIGNWSRCKSLSKELGNVKHVEFSLLANDVPVENQNDPGVYYQSADLETCWSEINIQTYDRIIILSTSLSEKNHDDLMDDKGELDAPTLFIANKINAFLTERKQRETVTIIAEMRNHRYYHLFQSSADVVIPVTIFIERLLIKGIYHHGNIAHFLTALLAEQDGTYLLSYTISENDVFLREKMTVKTLFSQTDQGIQVLGYHPKKLTQALRKSGADFSRHFAISPQDLEMICKEKPVRSAIKKIFLGNSHQPPVNRDSLLQAGDIVIMIFSESSKA